MGPLYTARRGRASWQLRGVPGDPGCVVLRRLTQRTGAWPGRGRAGSGEALLDHVLGGGARGDARLVVVLLDGAAAEAEARGRAGSGEALLDRVAGGGGARGDAEFVVGRAQVLLDGAAAEAEARSDRGVGQALRHQSQHL